MKAPSNAESIFKEMWKLRVELFNTQKDLILWAQQFLPDDRKAEYNLKLLRINYLLDKTKEQEKLLQSIYDKELKELEPKKKLSDRFKNLEGFDDEK